MRVLIACEFSGVVRRAFRSRGHDAWSCDLLPAEDESPYHYECDIWKVLSRNPWWDLMIAHPECTYLCNSGVRWLYHGGRRSGGVNAARWQEMTHAAGFFTALYHFGAIPRIAIENPVMHGDAKYLIGVEPTQSIQPWQFGHGEVKRTCLWLRNLPPLVPTEIVDGREPRVHHESPGPDRWKRRSRTYEGIAAAMADQWGRLDH